MSTEHASSSGSNGEKLNPSQVVDPHKLRSGVKLAKAVVRGFAEDALTPNVPRHLRAQDTDPVQDEERADTEEGSQLLAERARRLIAARDKQRKAHIESVMPALKEEAGQRYDASAFKGERVKNEAGRDVLRYTRDQLTEQTRLLGLVQDLIAERRDLTRSLLDEEKKLAKAPAKADPPPIKRIGGVRIVMSRGRTAEAAVPEVLLAGHKRLEEVDHELAVLGAVDGLRAAYERKLSIAWLLARITKRVEELEDRNACIDDEIGLIRAEARRGRTGVVTGINQKKIEALTAEKAENQEKIDVYYKSEDGHYISRSKTLHEYTNDYARGRIIGIPSVVKIVKKGMEHMENNQPFLLAGHLGSGKTEVARHMAKLHMLKFVPEEEWIDNSDPAHPRQRTENEMYDRMTPEFFSGSDEATVYDLIGKLKLTSSAINEKNLAQNVEALSKAMEQAGIHGVPREEIAKILIGKGDASVTMFNYGPFARAMKRGVPIIVDEVNRISQQTNSRINDLLLRRPGTRVRLQENGEEEMEIGSGFAVLGTCNLGAQYNGINDFDAAFKSRWVAEEVGYPELAESYDLILAALLRKDRVRLPPEFPAESFERLVDLAIVVHEIQDVFAGKTKAQRFMAMNTNVVAQRSQLEKAVISTRDLMRKIVDPWVKSGFKQKPEDVLAAQADVQAKEEEVSAAEAAPPASPPSAEATPPAAPTEEDPVVEEVLEEAGEAAEAAPAMENMVAPMEALQDKAYTDGLDEIVARNILASEVFSSDDQKLMTELFIRRGFFVGWSEARFHAMGIRSVSKDELNALQAQRGKDDYKKENEAIEAIRASARQQTAALFAGLTSGNFGMMRPEEEKVLPLRSAKRAGGASMGMVGKAAA